MKLHEAFSPEESKKIYDNFLAIVNDPKRRDRLVRKHGKNAENVAYGTAVNQVKRQAANTIEEPQPEETMEDTRLREMVIDALSEKKKSTAFTSQYDDKFDDKRKDLPDGLQKAILKKQGELDEANLYSGEKWSIEPEGRFWIVTYKTMDGKKEKVFQSEDEAKEFTKTLNEDLDLGHTDDEPHMLKADLYRIGKYAMELYKMVDQFEGEQEVDFPHWWQSKIIQAKSMLVSAKHYLDFETKEPQIDAMVDVASEEGAIGEEMTPEKSEKIGMPFKGIDEKLKPSMGAGAYVDDFRKSDAPQFQNKSKGKKDKMAVAAYLSAEDKIKKKIKEAVLAKLQESKGEYAKIEKQIADLKSKGKNAGDAEMQKLIKRRAELEKSKK